MRLFEMVQVHLPIINQAERHLVAPSPIGSTRTPEGIPRLSSACRAELGS